jgi:hypothetical protein
MIVKLIYELMELLLCSSASSKSMYHMYCAVLVSACRYKLYTTYCIVRSEIVLLMSSS